MDGIEMICFEIISNVGMARGSYVEAIDLATEGKFDEARAKIEAAGEKTEIILVLVHAEDQLMSAENFKILAEKFIALSEKIYTK